MNKQQQVIIELRRWLNVDEESASDEKLLKATDGTFGRARIELGIALRDCWRTIAKSNPLLVRWMFRPLFCLMFSGMRFLAWLLHLRGN